MIQTAGYVTQMLNWGHYHRRIPLDNRSRPGVGAKFWMGVPRGRWDGDTLVVESTNFNGKMWLDSVGNFVSPNVRVTERFRLVEANTLDYEVTIDDPQVFTQVVDAELSAAAPGRRRWRRRRARSVRERELGTRVPRGKREPRRRHAAPRLQVVHAGGAARGRSDPTFSRTRGSAAPNPPYCGAPA